MGNSKWILILGLQDRLNAGFVTHPILWAVLMALDATKKSRVTLLHVDLKDLKNPWSEWCAAAGLTPSEGIRQLVRRAVGAQISGDLLAAKADHDPDSRLRRYELRMTHDEAAALAAAAKQAGMSSSKYLVCLLRAHLMGQPYFGTEEIGGLVRSNRFLMELVTAMKKAARDPTTPAEARRINQAQVQFIKDFVEKHVRSVSALLTANSRRWRR